MLNKLMPVLLFVALMFVGFKVVDAVAHMGSEPTQGETAVLRVPAGAKLVNVDCGGACILFWDGEQYVALYPDGKKMFIVFDTTD